MAIQVNIQPIFEEDNAGRLVEKLNINFNKLLELGIGEEGPQGPAGIQGPIGPPGPIGAQGRRGSLWFADNGTPNGSPDLSGFNIKTGDLYIDTQTGDFYQFTGSPGTWDNIGPVLSNVVNNVVQNLGLAVNTFLRDFYNQTSPNSETAEDFVVFKNRNLGGSVQDNGDLLFLSNFDENPLDFDAEELYRSISSTYVDELSTANYRYHAEFGALYKDTNNNEDKLTNETQNFKLYYDYDFGSSLARAIFHMSKPNLYRGPNSPNINDDSRFEFYTTDRNNSSSVITYIGNNQAINGLTNINVGDGILLESNSQYTGIGVDINNNKTLFSTSFNNFRFENDSGNTFAELYQINTDPTSAINLNDEVEILQTYNTSGNNNAKIELRSPNSDLSTIKPNKTKSTVYPPNLGEIDSSGNEYPFSNLYLIDSLTITESTVTSLSGIFEFRHHNGSGTINSIFGFDSTGVGIGATLSQSISAELDVGGNAIIRDRAVIGDTTFNSNISDENLKVVGKSIFENIVRYKASSGYSIFIIPGQIYTIDPVENYINIEVDSTGNQISSVVPLTINSPDGLTKDESDGTWLWVKIAKETKGDHNLQIEIDKSTISNSTSNILIYHNDGSQNTIVHKLLTFVYDGITDGWVLIDTKSII